MVDKELKSINDIYTKEFPDTMTFDVISAMVDTLKNDAHIEELRCIFCYNLVF